MSAVGRRRLRAPEALAVAIATAIACTAGAAQQAPPGAPAHDAKLAKKLSAAAAARPVSEVRTRHRQPDGSPTYTNRLVLEKSPYLLQHAHNPVDWYPWGDAAFEAARRLDRPVLVSIGYSTCHWCHVMEEESFDDVAIATLLNERFIAIKVDREVRPDVDAVYMAAVHALGKQGGWPLNVWLTPDREPFYGGTYFPPEDRGGRPGFPRVLTTLSDLYRDRPDDVRAESKKVVAAVSENLAAASAKASRIPPPTLLDRALEGFASAYDPDFGGLRGRTKFPSTLPARLLLRMHRRSGDPRALEMATHTLTTMARSGLRDHIGGGFHRYSTDPQWRVPHFEKMLYDNALLVLDYLEAWQATGRRDFAEVALDTARTIIGEFGAPGGGFHSASDADSLTPEGELEEGRFFTWTREEIEAALGDEDASLALAWFAGDHVGEVEGRLVLQAPPDPEAVAERLELEPAGLRERLATIRARLAERRAQRSVPLRDEKILSAWNGLAISALARTGFALERAELVAAAAEAARRVLDTRDGEGRLRRVRVADGVYGVAFLDDYAFTIAGLIDLYESDPDPRWLAEALALQRRLDDDFGDAEGGGYYRTAGGEKALLVREKPVDDGAIPSGNGVALLNLLRLAALTGDDAHHARARAGFAAFHTAMQEQALRAGSLLSALDWLHDTHLEVIVLQPESGDGNPAMLDVLRRVHRSNRVQAVVREGDEAATHAELVSLIKGKKARGGRTTAYVCENRTCRFPTADPAEFEQQLLRKASEEPAS